MMANGFLRSLVEGMRGFCRKLGFRCGGRGEIGVCVAKNTFANPFADWGG